MRATKKDIYNKYGIQYQDGKIYAPMFGWINPVLINGNDKLGRGVWTWSTLPANIEYQFEYKGFSYLTKGTCPCNCPGCYAQTGCYCFMSVKACNARKTILARLYREWLKNAILAQIEADKIKFLRIHAAGDFFDLEYINMWHEIVMLTPSVIYWTYTKNPIAESSFDDLDNINIVRSIIPGHGFNFGPCAYILKVYNALKEAGKSVYICRCGIDKNQHCSGCKGCSNHEHVLFIEHSTAYKAEEDPLYDTLKAVIEAQ